MRGFSFWMWSQVKPMRSSAPGAKFSTITSQVRTRASSTSLPLGLRPSMVMERLLWFSMVKYRLSTLGMSCNCPRVISPTPGRSTLMTSAPNQASNCVQVGPDCTWLKSRILTPSSALDMEVSRFVHQGRLRPSSGATPAGKGSDRVLIEKIAEFFYVRGQAQRVLAHQAFRLIRIVRRQRGDDVAVVAN